MASSFVKSPEEMFIEVKTNIEKMLKDRTNSSSSIVWKKLGSKFCITGVFRQNSTTYNCCVILQKMRAVHEKFSIGNLRKVVKEVITIEKTCRHIIIVSSILVTPANQRSLCSENKDYRLEFFDVQTFYTYLPELDIIDPHIPLTQEESKRYTKRYGSTDKFPTMYSCDPICRWYDFRHDMLIKVIEAVDGCNLVTRVVRVINEDTQ